MYKDRIYFGTTDAHLVCLNARTGKEIWNVEIADVGFDTTSSVAPLVVKDKLIIGSSDDQADVPHFIEAIDPENGKVLWRFDTLPCAWQPGGEELAGQRISQPRRRPSMDDGDLRSDLNLIYWGTGNPHPVLAGVVREGAHLGTCSIVALNPDTGKLVWYYQPSPHDTHDWDADKTPVLFEPSRWKDP